MPTFVIFQYMIFQDKAFRAHGRFICFWRFVVCPQRFIYLPLAISWDYALFVVTVEICNLSFWASTLCSRCIFLVRGLLGTISLFWRTKILVHHLTMNFVYKCLCRHLIPWTFVRRSVLCSDFLWLWTLGLLGRQSKFVRHWTATSGLLGPNSMHFQSFQRDEKMLTASFFNDVPFWAFSCSEIVVGLFLTAWPA